MPLALAFLIIGLAVLLLARGVDVRLVLFSAGLALALLVLRPWLVLDAFQTAMGNGEIIGPICTAMGYAFVLRAIGADQEMVRLLLAPIRRARALLIPGGCAVGFLANMAITSQTAVAAAVGPILVPLMLAAGYHPILAGATLVLGCSGGGNLLNPGDADIVAIHASTRAQGATLADVLDVVALHELAGFAAAVLAFTFLSRHAPREPAPDVRAAEPEPGRPIQWLKALLPPLPVAMVFALQPRVLDLLAGLELPGVARFRELYPGGLPVPHAMLLSVMVALLVGRRDLSSRTRSFFEGLGFAYAHVVSLIITATCFIEGMKAVGMIELLVGAIQGSGPAGRIASGVFPWMLGVLSGSGTAPCVAFARAVLPHVADRAEALDLGALAAVSSTFGRTMSPVAAVVIFTSTLVGVTPVSIVRRTAPALGVGALVVLALAVTR